MWLMARVIKSMGIKMVLSEEQMNFWRVLVFSQSSNAQEFITKKPFVN
jgi:hypothetical protein